MTGLKVLICDDSEVALEVAKDVLEEAGYSVIATQNPLTVAYFVRKESPNLVLIDVNMPSVAGDTIAQITAEKGLSKGIPVVLHSDLPAELLAQKAQKAGVAGFIRKTGDEQAFLNEVSRYLQPKNSDPGTAPIAGGSSDVEPT
jgi:CheY-like chemotaxis protein